MAQHMKNNPSVQALLQGSGRIFDTLGLGKNRKLKALTSFACGAKVKVDVKGNLKPATVESYEFCNDTILYTVVFNSGWREQKVPHKLLSEVQLSTDDQSCPQCKEPCDIHKYGKRPKTPV